jgi:hypothetical protein
MYKVSHEEKSGSKHLYLKYFRMCNLVQRDVNRQNKYIYIYLTKLKKNNGSLKIMGTTQKCFDIIRTMLCLPCVLWVFFWSKKSYEMVTNDNLDNTELV